MWTARRRLPPIFPDRRKCPSDYREQGAGGVYCRAGLPGAALCTGAVSAGGGEVLRGAGFPGKPSDLYAGAVLPGDELRADSSDGGPFSGDEGYGSGGRLSGKGGSGPALWLPSGNHRTAHAGRGHNAGAVSEAADGDENTGCESAGWKTACIGAGAAVCGNAGRKRGCTGTEVSFG